MTEDSYNLKKSKDALEAIYPVLEDAHGQVIDGMHRLAADQNWPRRRVEGIKTRKQFLVARIVANSQRRRVSKDERQREFILLAMELKDEGFEPGEIASEIVKLTGFSERYVRDLLPDKYKRSYEKTELSAELKIDEDLANIAVPAGTPEASEPSAEIFPEEEAPATLTEKDVTIATSTQPTARPQAAPFKGATDAEVDGWLKRIWNPVDDNTDFCIHSLINLFGFGRTEAEKRVKRFKRGGLTPSRTDEQEKVIRRRESKRHIAPSEQKTTTCPLCGRSGADRNLIQMKIEDPLLGQQTLSQFITEALQR